MSDERLMLLIEDDHDDLATGYDLGADSYIRRPVDFTQVMQAVDGLGLYWLVLSESPSPTES